MTTNAKSALEWFTTTNPDQQQLSTVLIKLEERINNESNAENDLTGTLEALDLLQQLFIENFEDNESSANKKYQDPSQSIDITPLGDAPNIEVEFNDESERKKRFKELKNQLNTLK